MWFLQSPHRFSVAGPLHHHKHQGNAAMFYTLKIKLEQNLKTKQKEQMITEILVIQKKNPKQPNKKLHHKIHSDMTIKETFFKKKPF